MILFEDLEIWEIYYSYDHPNFESLFINDYSNWQFKYQINDKFIYEIELLYKVDLNFDGYCVIWRDRSGLSSNYQTYSLYKERQQAHQAFKKDIEMYLEQASILKEYFNNL